MRRARGEGGISRRKDGRWQLTFVGLNGREETIYAPKTATRREANAKLAKLTQPGRHERGRGHGRGWR